MVTDKVRQFICGLHGHDALLHFEHGRMSLQCTSCGYETPGWDLKKASEPPLSRVGVLSAEERGQHTSRAVLYAFDAETGEELFSSKDAIDDWTHLSSITVADGSVYVTTRQSFVYAFGLKK